MTAVLLVWLLAQPPAAPADPAFAGKVDLTDLPRALGEADAPALADLATKLLVAEAVAGRPYQGVASDRLVTLAARAATETGHPELVEKLRAAVAGLKDHPLPADVRAKLAAALDARAKLAAGRRAIAPPPLSFTEADIEGGVYATYRRAADAIHRAAAVGDREALEAVAAGLYAGPGLPDAVRAALAARVADARDSLGDPDPAADALLKLAAPSRGGTVSGGPGVWNRADGTVSTLPGVKYLSPIFGAFPADVVKSRYLPDPALGGLPPLNQKVWQWCQGQLFHKVGNGQCGEINLYALKAATGKPVSYGAGPDYKWGKLVATIAPKKLGEVGNIKPGDLLQFRQVRTDETYTKKSGNSSYTWNWSAEAGHSDGSIGHSAVVRAVASGGLLVATFEQNLKDVQVEMRGVYNLDKLTRGTIWVYRPQ